MLNRMKKTGAILIALVMLAALVFVSAEGAQLLEQETGSPAQHLTVKAKYKGELYKIKTT